MQTAVALCLCVSMVAGAFCGVRILTLRGEISEYYQRHQASYQGDFTETSDFQESLEQFMELVELYLDVVSIWPQGDGSEQAAAIDGEGNALMMQDLSDAAGAEKEKYESYLTNYLKNQNTYYEKDISILELTEEIRSLSKMVVVDGDRLYYTAAAQEDGGSKKEQKKRDENLLKYLKGDGQGYVLQREDIKLPGFEEKLSSTKKYLLKYGNRTVSFQPQTVMQEKLFQKFSDSERRRYLWNLCFDYSKNDFKREDGSENTYLKKVFRSAYRQDCLKGNAGDFYEIARGDGPKMAAIDNVWTGEESTYFMNTVFYLKNGDEVTARYIVDGNVDSSQEIYNKSMGEYMLDLAENNWQSQQMSEELTWLEERDLIPVDISVAREYAAFLSSCYHCLQEEWKLSPFLFLIEGQEGKSISVGERIDDLRKAFDGKGVHILREDEGGMTREEEKELLESRGDIVFALYDKNGDVFRTNFTDEVLYGTGEMEEYFRRLSERDPENFSMLAVGADLKMIQNGKDTLSTLYRKFQSDQEKTQELVILLKKYIYYFLEIFAVIVVAFLLLALMTGHRKDSEEIVLLPVDRSWLEVALAAGFFTAIAFISLAYQLEVGLYYNYYYTDFREGYMQVAAAVVLSVLALFFAAVLLSLIRRIKAHQFWATSIICRKLKGPGGLLERGREGIHWMNEFLHELKAWKRYVIVAAINLIGGFIFLVGICGDLYESPFLLFMWADVLIVVWVDIRCIWRCLKNAVADERICRGAEQIAAGNLSYKIKVPAGVSKEQEELVNVINHIGQGLEHAVEDSVRNERMKAELITNVSHDIKTPLTSVINYVDLMKRETIENERVQEYLEVLDQKSQRLKVLIEDLVEASKASSGALELQITTLNFNELVNQTNGEFEEKFQRAGLTLISDIPQEPVVFRGDGRRVYRVLENLYANVAKYGMEGTRVYVSLSQKRDTEGGSGAVFTIKNISRDVLNVTSQELMERFVRGEQSRTTEGSGLGLSIAKSLTELMDGELTIYLDGDLFRVEVWFPM